MNLNLGEDESFSESEDLEVSRYNLVTSKKQSNMKQSSAKSSSSDESLTDLIRKRRQLINKNVYGKEEQKECIDATFDLSETYNESNKVKNLNESTLESRIKKLELELNTSLKSTQQRNYQHNQSASISSIDSFSLDYKQYNNNLIHYNNRLESIKSKQCTEPCIEWKKNRKIEEFDNEISTLQDELEQLKESIRKDENEQQKYKLKLKHKLKQHSTNSDSEQDNEQKKREDFYDFPRQQQQSSNRNKKNISSSKKQSQHQEQQQQQQQQQQHQLFKKKQNPQEDFKEDQEDFEYVATSKQSLKNKKKLSILEENNESSSDHLSDDDISDNLENNNPNIQSSKKKDLFKQLPISAIELNQKNGTELSLDVVPQKFVSKTENILPDQSQTVNVKVLELPSKTQLQSDISRLYKLNKEVEVLKQIEKIRDKLKKSINLKLNTEKVVEQYDPSFTMQSKSKIVNKSGKQHCPNCTYLLNKGMSSVLCHCKK